MYLLSLRHLESYKKQTCHPRGKNLACRWRCQIMCLCLRLFKILKDNGVSTQKEFQMGFSGVRLMCGWWNKWKKIKKIQLSTQAPYRLMFHLRSVRTSTTQSVFCQDMDNLNSILCLKASSVHTNRGLELLLVLWRAAHAAPPGGSCGHDERLVLC